VPVESQAQPAPAVGAALAEADFYAPYSWCLNPLLSLRDALLRLREELQLFTHRTLAWQREESRTNLFLFVGGVACVADDYLARRPYDLAHIGVRFPRLRAVVVVVQAVLDTCQAAYRAVVDRSVARWRVDWGECVDRVTELLLREAEPGDPSWNQLRRAIDALASVRLPGRLLQRRLPLPAAFRDHGLTHHDVVALAERFAVHYPEHTRPVAVVADRSVGSYFAPLVKARLAALGFRNVTCVAIRFEQTRSFRALTTGDARVLLIDPPPSLLGLVRRLSLPRECIVSMALRSEARPDGTPAGAAVLTLEPAEYHKARLLAPDALKKLLEEYRGGSGVHFVDDSELKEVNAAFGGRLKRAFAIRTGSSWEGMGATRILAASVGLGWLGYHAYFAATRLGRFVPAPIGLRQGLLFTEWVSASRLGSTAGASPSPRDLGAYVACRARSLRLTEDPTLERGQPSGTGWQLIMDILRRANGLYTGRLSIPALRRKVLEYRSPIPTLIDGRMRPSAWVASERGALNADFEQGLGEAALTVVDPAYDLATAIFEFGLSPSSQAELLDAYVEGSGDRAVDARLLLYKLLVGVHAMQQATRSLAAAPPRREQDVAHARYHAARNFLVDQMARDCGRLLAPPDAARWSKRLFFLDLDGVFDCDRLGFPHASASGLAALALLESRGFAVVPNTGRSIADVRGYCAHYGLPGGVAEFGNVFFDAVAGREIPLGDPAAAAQVAKCAAAIRELAGVFVDPAYRYSVRAYRLRGERQAPLEPREVEELLAHGGFDRLTCSAGWHDTFIFPRGNDKGRALVAVRQYLGCESEPVAAIGDSRQDIPMLEAADIAFAPASCTPAVRDLAARGGGGQSGKAKYRVVRQPMQRGLLAAARQLVRRLPPAGQPRANPLAAAVADGDLLATLLQLVDRPRWRQWLAALDRRGL
jgi:hypothetical protein